MASGARNSSTLILLTLCALASFCSFLDRRDIVTSHEARVAQTARQMSVSGPPWGAACLRVPTVGLVVENGAKRLAAIPGAGTTAVNPWLVPTINGNIRLQKPPLPYWLTAMLYRVVGFNDEAARWWPALLGALSMLLVADLARLIYGSTAPLIAALVWISTQFIVDEFRKSLADPYLAFATLLAVWAWLRACRSPARGVAWLLLFYIAVGIALLAKGPPLFLSLFPAMASAAFFLRRWPRLPAVWHLIGITIVAVLVLPWVVYVIRHVPHAIDIWQYESIGEFGDNAEKARPWWMYLPSCFQLPLPWTPMWLAGFGFAIIGLRKRSWRALRSRRRLFAIAWFAIVLLGFSCAHVKKNAYLLPVMAAQTLIVVDGLQMTLAFARRNRMNGLSGVALLIQCIIGIAFSVGLTVAASRQLHVDRAMTMIVCSAATLLCIVPLVPIGRRLPDVWLKLQAVAYVSVIVALLGFYQAADDNLRSPRQFAEETVAYSNANHIAIATAMLPEEASVYMPMNYLRDNSESTNASSAQVLVMIDDNRHAIDKGLLTPDAAFFSQYVAEIPVLRFRQVHLDHEEDFLRWKLFEVTVDRSRM